MKMLCNGIDLQQGIQNEVMEYYRSEHFRRIRNIADGLKRMESEAAARAELTKFFGEDEKRVKMLTCMLSCAAEQYQWYEKKGISETIFWDTMRCFTRFIGECRKITGIDAFDREWWTARQVSGTLFRIGTLEYEMQYCGQTCDMHRDIQEESEPQISIHIPSDADLTPDCCDRSIADATIFFERHFPEFRSADYICHSWLLAPELTGLLPEASRILAFQKRFSIRRVDYSESEFIEWVFKTRNVETADLPEQTTLQKNMKRHLLNGGKIGSGFGVLAGRKANHNSSCLF
ncbi:MAG: acyltransferase domain-containing protein [Lachnospiraceae bacterium]|nr:acyltransferase domain-containing protein [Lachnospiraceae bacterium]